MTLPVTFEVKIVCLSHKNHQQILALAIVIASWKCLATLRELFVGVKKQTQ
jgi:hypothetical protein